MTEKCFLLMCRYLNNAQSTLDALLKVKVNAVPVHIQSTFVQNILKIYTSVVAKAEAEGNDEVVRLVTQTLIDRLPVFVQSSDLEVQERVSADLSGVR